MVVARELAAIQNLPARERRVARKAILLKYGTGKRGSGHCYAALRALGIETPPVGGWKKAFIAGRPQPTRPEREESKTLRRAWFSSLAPSAVTEKEKRRSASLRRAPKRVAPEPTRAARSSPNPCSPEFLVSWEWTTLRFKVLKHYGRRCMCCGATPETGAVINVDHIRPRSRYPELALVFDNLQVLCLLCNKGKGAWSEDDFRGVG